MHLWSPSPQRPARHTAPSVRPTLELLEDRCVPSAGFMQTNLASDIPNLAEHTNANLLNPWGFATAPFGPIVISNNGSGTATAVNAQGAPLPAFHPLVIQVPAGAASGSDATGVPTGEVFNITRGFRVPAHGLSVPALYLFATEDGTISAWNPVANRTQAVVLVDNSAGGAVYKGLAEGRGAQGQPLIYATNFSAGTVDVFDANFQPVDLGANAFQDPTIPAGFAPFGIQNIGGKIYVTYAKQDSDKHDDVPGPGNGFVDVYSTTGQLLGRLISGVPLNSPWGLAKAPAGFGDFGGDLLVGNFGDGGINVFNLQTGQFIGPLEDGQGQPITIDGLWGLHFGTGGLGGDRHTLFFTAGINDEQDGLFGSLRVIPGTAG